MLWLDGTPDYADPNAPGGPRGPCASDSGDPKMLQEKYPDAAVVFSNIKQGEIGSTFSGTPTSEFAARSMGRRHARDVVRH
jgi:cellulose 1,4-beta-cellobiosidase